MDNWDDVKFVLALSRHGTMTAAAQALGTNVATVSRRIDRITEESAAPLFVKKDGIWTATATAAGFIRAADEFDARLRSERNNARTEAGHSDQVVRISAMPFVHQQILIPALPLLYRTRPFARIVLRNGSDSLGLGETDIALRFGRPESGRLVARRVAELGFHAYRSARCEAISGWVALGEGNATRPSALLGKSYFDGEPAVWCDTFEHMRCVIETTGRPGVLPDVVGLTGDGVVPDERHSTGTHLDVWMAFHQSRRADTALRATADWIVTAFAASEWAQLADDADIAAE